MDRPVREKKRTNHYDPTKEAAKPQRKKPKKSEDKKPHVKGPNSFVIGTAEINTRCAMNMKRECHQCTKKVRR